ncbi:Spy/CpxP family protein refolding chaperone [Candidatus Kryptobacter tengchongensis]|uniref:Protein refolding chaperone Spy/CpxP family n=1 Tax=Kryptobacter tengchongensis TaxID=1643429 RepID=A0A916LK62_KRYT1|nr:Spy/CpxP family protein refolding chaperone [Candidatus Kryptobacter tengchongensis]CUT01279.1 protein refolding chaperone Spy/CpxP family [Candidatus Kryptobacter tengchongensis]
MKTKIISTAIALFLITSLSFSQMLGPRFGFPPDDNIWQRGITKLYDELKLTDEQKSKIQNLFFEFRKNQADIIGKLNKARIELQELLYAEKPDKSAIDKKTDEISAYMKELTKNRVNHWMNIQQVLTPEQRKILKDKLGYPGLGLGFRGWAKPGRGLKLRLHCW